MEDLGNLLKDAIENATMERGHINILIAGKTGVGKSTLINAVFQQNLAETGQGRRVTKSTREITKDGVPLTIFDTRGLELEKFQETLSELEKIIKDRSGDKDSNRHIHVAWLCIQEGSDRVEDAEIDLHDMLSRHVPIINVITKASSDNGFKNKVSELLPESKNTIRVRAVSSKLDDGHFLGPMGLDKLVELTSEVIPEGKRRALAAAQKACLEYKKKQANIVVATAATAAAAVGASPVPFSDAALLAPIQFSMIAGITSVFGLELSEGTLSTLLASAIGVSGSTILGRTLVLNIIKLVPGVGTIVGGVISGATAFTITAGLGTAYIAVLTEIFSENPDAVPNAEDIGNRLKKKMA